MLPVALVALPHDWRFLPAHISVFITVLAVAWRGAYVDRALEGASGWRWLLMASASAALAWTLVGASPRSGWGMIDDHEIHNFIGPRRDRIPAGELPALIAAHPEIGAPPFTIPRYRPTYYLFRLVECSAWGKHIEPWMILRLGLFTLTALLAFDLLRQWLGFVAGGVALGCLATLWMWPKIFITLGPSEAYAAPAVMAFAWFATAIMRGSRPAGAGRWAGLAVAALIAIGAKENFAILAPLAALLAGIEWRRGRLGVAGATACGTVVLAALWVAIVVGTSIAAQGGRDLYDRPLGLSGFVRRGDGSSLRAIRKVAGYGLPLAAATAWMALTWHRRATISTGHRILLGVGTVLGLAALSQFFFYRGEVFKKSHYDLPFVPLVCVLEIGALAVAAGWGGGSVLQHRLRRRLLVPGVLAATAMALGGDHARHYTRDYARETTAFSAIVDQVAEACQAEPDRAVECMIMSDLRRNYEPLHSVVRFLRARGVGNPLFLNPHGLPAGGDTAGASRHDLELATLSREGGQSFEPWGKLKQHACPITICFSGDPPVERRPAFRFR